MSDAGDKDGFERRLAGQPTDPAVSTRELLASTGQSEPSDPSKLFGEMRLTELTSGTVKPQRPSPLPWIVAGVLAAVLLISIIVFVIPSSQRASEAQAALADAQARLAGAEDQLQAFREQVVELTRERDALAAETEKRAGELAEMQRSVEQAEATAKRLAADAAAKSPGKPVKSSKRRKKRRR